MENCLNKYFADDENNKEVVQHKLYEFMCRMEQHKDK